MRYQSWPKDLLVRPNFFHVLREYSTKSVEAKDVRFRLFMTPGTPGKSGEMRPAFKPAEPTHKTEAITL